MFTTHKSLIPNFAYPVKDGLTMKRSKLEMHVDILKVLAQRGPLQQTDIMYQANLNCNVLEENLIFLIKQGLVEEVVIGKNSVVYANTNRGSAVVRFFGELDKSLLVNEEEVNSCQFPIETEN